MISHEAFIFQTALCHLHYPHFKRELGHKVPFHLCCACSVHAAKLLSVRVFFLQFHSLPVSSPSALRTSVFLSTLIAAALIRKRHSHSHTLSHDDTNVHAGFFSASAGSRTLRAIAYSLRNYRGSKSRGKQERQHKKERAVD